MKPKLSRDERLDEIALEVNKGWSNSDDVWSFDVDDMKFLLNQAYEAKQLRKENEKLREADKIVKVLYVGLGMNVDGDLKLWKKTEAYVKSLEETK